MISGSTELNEVAQAFSGLEVNDQLGLLALIYGEVGSSIPAGSLPTSEVSGIVSKVESLSQAEQVGALGDLLSAKKSDDKEVVLDPHPSQALAELAGGGTTVPTGDYGSLGAEAKLAFWSQIAQKLGKGAIAIPSDYSPSGAAMELLNSLKSMGSEQLVAFVSQVV